MTMAGCLVVLFSMVAYIVTGIYTYDWVGVHNFWSAILWLFVWHVVAVVVSGIWTAIVMIVTEWID